ncbi:MAG: hypothetical protein OEW15_06815 [Nitrospirota bacterium]|nr:hypothetical protein [Nitrospirota bacterium]
MAQSWGVPFQMSRKLGDSVEVMVARLGLGAAAFGGVAIAGMALYGVYGMITERQRRLEEETRKAIEAKKKLREETIMGATAAGEWLTKADETIKKTQSVMRAEYDLYLVEHARNREKLGSGILAQEQKILDIKRQSMDFVVIEGAAIEVGKSRNKNLQLQLQYEEKKLRLMQEQLGTAVREKTFTEFTSDGKAGERSAVEVRLSDDIRFQEQYSGALVSLSKARSDSMQEIFQGELEYFDAATAHKLANATSEQDYYDTLAVREMERQTMVLNHDQETNKLRVQAAQDMATGLGQTFQTLYQLGGSHARKYFTLYKAAAISETLISTFKAAQDSYAFGAKIGGPALGATMSVIATAAGMSKVAAIRAQNFNGGGSGGADASGGSGSVRDYTGVGRDNNEYRYFNYEQSKYGTGWRPGEGQAVNNITINAVDARSFEQLANDNPKAIVNVVKRWQQGYV